MRIRTIKPDFWTSLTISKLSLGARLTFLGLLNISDDSGRGVADPRLIKAAIWPLDEEYGTTTVRDWMREIEAQSLAILYTIDDKPLFQICSFREHQKISKPTESSLPAPVGFQEDSGSPPGGLPVGKERKGKEGSLPGTLPESSKGVV